MAASGLMTVVDRLRHSSRRAQLAQLSDGQQLERFIADRSEAALAELIRRHVPRADICDMELVESANGKLTYKVVIPCEASGQFGYAVRVLPQHALLPHPFESGLVIWG